MDDSELQDEPLQIRLMDHDTYSANDAIGKVYLDLNPLLLPAASSLIRYGWTGDANHENASNSVMSGWIPVYDTMHGIRGEVNVIVKVELFSDFNRFRQSSCGIQFFCCKFSFLLAIICVKCISKFTLHLTTRIMLILNVL